jgi:AcrR family transcriptional regulator
VGAVAIVPADRPAAGAVEEARKPGRPRDARADRAILEATLDLVGETGLAGLTVDAVAARAGVSKATIYRRWDSKEALVLAAWHECGAQLPSPDTGSLRGDLEELCAAIRDGIGKGVMERVFPQMLAAARVNKELGEDFDRFLHERRRPTREVLRRARDRGELAPDADLELIHDLLVGPITYRVLVKGSRLGAAMIDSLIELVVRATAPAPPDPAPPAAAPAPRTS